jgi:hypothetical protein
LTSAAVDCATTADFPVLSGLESLLEDVPVRFRGLGGIDQAVH